MAKTNLSSPGLEALKQELERLYQRRLAVDRLIRSLEEYSEIRQAAPLGRWTKSGQGGNPARHWV